jgi:hypothetical protein
MELVNNEYLLVYGGSDWKVFFSSIHIYDIQQNIWFECATTGNIPDGR